MKNRLQIYNLQWQNLH